MNTIFSTILILILSFPVFAQKQVTLQPVVKKESVKIISGNQNYYYALNTTNTVVFDVLKYDKVVVYSRERINGKGLGYTLGYTLDNSKSQYTVNAKGRDYKSSYSDKSIGKNVSLFSKKTIEIPKQANTIRFEIINGTNIDIKVGGFIGSKRTFLEPIDQNATRVRIAKGKTYNYFKLNSKIPTLIETNKEGELIVYTRKRMSEKSSDTYTFSYQFENNEAVKVFIRNVNSSVQAAYSSLSIKETPSTYNKTVIKVADINQKILFSSDFPIDARFVFQKTIKKDGWEELESNTSKIVPLLVKKNQVVRDYTRIETGKPFNFSVVNAKEIKVFIRGEFQYDMHANNDYEIVLKDNGEIINTYKLSCHRSNVMQYKYNDELIPGTLDKFFITVSQGKHNYSISIGNSKKTALVRVLKKM